MKNPIRTYSFWLKIISAAFLIIFGIWLLIDDQLSTFIVLLFTGLVAGIFALIRVIPLFRTLKTNKARLTCFVEILIHIAICAVLIVGAVFVFKDKDSGFAKFIGQNYRFFVAVFFLTRTFSYMACTILFGEQSDLTSFFVTILLIILSCVICSLSDIKSETVALIIGILALICGAGLIIDGGFGYNRYRRSIAPKVKDKEKKEETELEVPPADSIIVPVKDDRPTDSNQIS